MPAALRSVGSPGTSLERPNKWINCKMCSCANVTFWSSMMDHDVPLIELQGEHDPVIWTLFNPSKGDLCEDNESGRQTHEGQRDSTNRRRSHCGPVVSVKTDREVNRICPLSGPLVSSAS
ncbi:hypothetical protein Bbelb_273490 [Branchiostoma belcheri]|nr:hypothetical protein Bbelb_273490 [Branchiostoma belcheri]